MSLKNNQNKFDFVLFLTKRLIGYIIIIMTEEMRNRISALIVMIAKGNDGAAAELAYLVSARMLSVARSVLHDKAKAEDAVQDSFIRIFENANKFKSGTNGYAWICKIVQNTALNMLRRDRASVDLDECFYLADETDVASRSAQSLAVEQVMSVLDIPEKRLIYQKYFMDFTVRDSAKSLGLSKSAAARKIVAAENKMREYISSRDKNGQ